VLPLGISFYTLTQVAFIADVAAGKAREYDFPRYLLFVELLSASHRRPGAASRAQVMPQFDRDSTYRPRAANFAAGITFFSIGLAKKVLLADSLGEHATRIRGGAGGRALDSLFAWTGAAPILCSCTSISPATRTWPWDCPACSA
jgi:alginate O-acetyltransferase complex protein AlgI